MRKTILTTAAVAAFSLALAASPVHAQTAREEAAARREYLLEHHGEKNVKWEKVSVENKAAFREHMKEVNEQQRLLAARVKAHEIDNKASAAQMRAWRDAHKPGY
jgi:hypothetical protein